MAFCAAMTLAACSDADSNPVVETPNTATGELKEIRKIHHEENYTHNSVEHYTDGFLMRIDHIVAGTITWHEDYTYNDDGLIASYNLVHGNGSDKHDYTYNNAGKLIKKVYYKNGELRSQTIYDYTTNVISPVTENLITGEITTGNYFFYINSNGVIYKLRDVSFGGIEQIYEIEYDGYNPVSAYDYSQEMDFSFTFDDTHDHSLLGIHDGYGTFKANAILREDWIFDNEAIFATKYILNKQITYNGGETWYTENHAYTFADNGKPIADEVIVNGDLSIEAEYIYE